METEIDLGAHVVVIGKKKIIGDVGTIPTSHLESVSGTSLKMTTGATIVEDPVIEVDQAIIAVEAQMVQTMRQMRQMLPRLRSVLVNWQQCKTQLQI
jgi:hypothetical protein